MRAFENPSKEKAAVTKEHLEKVFEKGRRLAKKEAATALMKLTGFGGTVCYKALSKDARFKDYLVESEDGLLSWRPSVN